MNQRLTISPQDELLTADRLLDYLTGKTHIKPEADVEAEIQLLSDSADQANQIRRG
jgi:hypothetical protein